MPKLEQKKKTKKNFVALRKKNTQFTISLWTFYFLQLYVPLNIFIALVGVVVWTEQNEIELSSDGDKTLKNFLIYRRKVLVKDHRNDNAQLLTKVQFDGGVVGKKEKIPIQMTKM